MLSSQKTLCTLEYDKIIGMLVELAATGGAKARAGTLLPTDDAFTVRKRQCETTDARRLVGVKGYPSFSADELVIPALDRAEKGATLSTGELLRISSLLHSARGLIDYLHTDRLFETVLDEIFDRIQANRYLESMIDKAILSEDMIADEASPALADIRRKIRGVNNKIKDTLAGYTGGQRSKYLQENIVTVRGGRYVVPVKAEYRNEIKGLVHDTSSSGATLFVEPMAIIEANNELRALESKERAEIDRILAELSAACADSSGVIRQDYYAITELSFIYAKASLAEKMKANAPSISDIPGVRLYDARHPLIDSSRVVPICVSVGGEYDTLIITGPNTGGKTVTLKTIGLLSLMAQAGLHIPASERSEIGVFGEILVDLGDEQSIEQSLSTFSSHMVNIVDILGTVGPRSLVLFDELGAGTDPIEGAALAISILEKVRAASALSAATTHYAELKAYALDTKGVQNASCEFNIDTLRPTYRLIVGMPGKSNAFAISERLGLSSDVVESAKRMVSSENRRFERVIERLESDRIEMERNREEAQRLRLEYEHFKADAEEKLQRRLAESEKEILREREKARRMIDSARINSEVVFKELAEIRKKQERGDFAKQLAEARERVREALKESEHVYDAYAPNISLDEEYVLPRPLVIGDEVYIVPYHQEGVVTAIAGRDGFVSVRAGILKARIAEKDLRLITGQKKKPSPEKKAKPSEGKIKKSIVGEFKAELDIRGRYGEDGWEETDKYLDSAVLAGLTVARIVHGKGTGALKKAIWERLKSDPRVKSFRLGNYGEGDSGVTVVELK